MRLQDSGPALGTVTVQATTPIYLDLKPGKNDLVLPQHSGYSKYKLVICRDIDPDQLPRTYDAAETSKSIIYGVIAWAAANPIDIRGAATQWHSNKLWSIQESEGLLRQEKALQ